MKQSKIEWTRSTFNPWWGCAKVSPGCQHCYAEAFDRRTFGTEKHTAADGEVREPHWGKDAPRRFFGDAHWREPLAWNAEALETGEPWRVFCSSMADVFEDRRDLDPWRERLWALIDKTPALTWLLLTKRPENTARLIPESWRSCVPNNVWRGVTCESPDYLWRVEKMLAGPGGTTFVSYEPALAEVSFAPYLTPRFENAGGQRVLNRRCVQWIIVGGESGPGARPFNVAWARGVVEECARLGAACLVKQMGAKPYMEPTVAGSAIPIPLKDAKGGDWSEWPKDLRVREYPTGVRG